MPENKTKTIILASLPDYKSNPSTKSDTKGTFHAKMGTIKARNGMDLTEAEDTKKRWKEYIEQ